MNKLREKVDKIIELVNKHGFLEAFVTNEKSQEHAARMDNKINKLKGR